MRFALGARTGIGHDVPWPELLAALDPIDPDMAAMVRRILEIPTSGERKRRRRGSGKVDRVIERAGIVGLLGLLASSAAPMVTQSIAPFL